MTKQQELYSVFSDLYKSFTGRRPRWAANFTVAELEIYIERTQNDLLTETKEEQLAKAKEKAALKPSPAWTIGDLIGG
jgi:hypothetical protein